VKRREGTAHLKKVNEAAKEAATVIHENKAGRPPKYHPHFITMVEVLGTSLIGTTNVQLAGMFGVDSDTIAKWLQAHPKFSNTIIRAREMVDREIEEALFLRAKGYTHPEEKVFCAPRTGEIVVHHTTMRYPPDTKAGMFWLMNRNRDKWNTKDGGATPPSDAADQLRAALAEVEKQTQGGKK